MHFYVDFLVYAQRCFEEISFDTIGNIRSVRIPINEFSCAPLPDDYMDWCKIGVQIGQFVKPLINRPGMNRLRNYNYYNTIATYSLTAGTGYADGTYSNIALTGGTGKNVVVNITYASGVPSVTLVNPGQDFTIGDRLTGTFGSGTNFSLTVLTLVDSDEINYPDEFVDDSTERVDSPGYPYFNTNFLTGYYVNYNDHLEYTGRDYGGRMSRTDTFKVIKERNEIQLHEDLQATYIVLEYVSDGSEIDNATQITPYAKSTFEAFINWKHKENGRSYGEGERERAQQNFNKQHRILRARMSDLTLSDIKASIYKNSSGAPK